MLGAEYLASEPVISAVSGGRGDQQRGAWGS